LNLISSWCFDLILLCCSWCSWDARRTELAATFKFTFKAFMFHSLKYILKQKISNKRTKMYATSLLKNKFWKKKHTAKSASKRENSENGKWIQKLLFMVISAWIKFQVFGQRHFIKIIWPFKHQDHANWNYSLRQLKKSRQLPNHPQLPIGSLTT
jgi:hypothetical protein